MKKLQDAAAFVFIIAVAILAVISILGVWDFFHKDVITKSFETLGLLAMVALIVIVAGRFLGRGQDANAVVLPPNPMFRSMRRGTLGVLIGSVSVLALLGVCAIWEIITDKDVLYKSLGSVAILAFCSFVIVLTCLDREGDNPLRKNRSFSVGGIILILFLMYLMFAISRAFWY